MFEFKATKDKEPMFNEPLLVPSYSISTKPTKYADMDYWLERSPEMIGILDVLTSDVLGDGFRFEGGRNKIDRAEKFARRVMLKEELSKAIFDWHFYGDGYLWKGTPIHKLKSLPQLKNVDLKSIDFSDQMVLKHVATTTVNIDPTPDKRAIKQYRQLINGKTESTWEPDEILHAKYLTIKGKLYGFSPAQAMLVELQTIGYVKDYASTFFSRGGYPDKIFNFKKDSPNSPHVQRAIQQLQKYEHPTEKRGNMVMTGELEVSDLNQMTKDMEFRQLAVYLTGVMAVGYGVPMSRVASVIGSAVKITTGSDDLANESYWARVATKQDYWEDLLNRQVFEDIGVEIKFNRGYKMNEVRETMAMIQKLDALQSFRNLGMTPNIKLIRTLFPDLDESYFKSIDIKKPEEMQNAQRGPNNRQNYQKLGDLEKGPATQGRSRQKEKETDSSFREEKETGY